MIKPAPPVPKTSLVMKHCQTDWSALKGLIPKYSDAVPTDIDGFVERKRHFLVIETKFAMQYGRPMPKGQEIALLHTSELPKFTVVVCWNIGKETATPGVWDFVPFKWQFYIAGHKGPCTNVTLPEFCDWYVGWFNGCK